MATIYELHSGAAVPSWGNRIYLGAPLNYNAENVFNLCKPLFATPSVRSATNTAFGTITGQTDNPRYIQFGLRLTF